MTYSIVAGNQDKALTIDNTGSLTLNKPIFKNEGIHNSIRKILIAVNTPTGSNYIPVIIHNKLDEGPQVPVSPTMLIPDHGTAGQIIVNDLGIRDFEDQNLIYTIESGNEDDIFAINKNGRLIFNKDIANGELSAIRREIMIKATDSKGQYATITYSLIFSSQSGPYVPEHELFTVTAATKDIEIGQITATKEAGNDNPISFKIIEGNDDSVFSINDDGKVRLDKMLTPGRRRLVVSVSQQGIGNLETAKLSKPIIVDINIQPSLQQLPIVPSKQLALMATDQQFYNGDIIARISSAPFAGSVYNFSITTTNEYIDIDSNTGQIIAKKAFKADEIHKPISVTVTDKRNNVSKEVELLITSDRKGALAFVKSANGKKISGDIILGVENFIVKANGDYYGDEIIAELKELFKTTTSHLPVPEPQQEGRSSRGRRTVLEEIWSGLRYRGRGYSQLPQEASEAMEMTEFGAESMAAGEPLLAGGLAGGAIAGGATAGGAGLSGEAIAGIVAGAGVLIGGGIAFLWWLFSGSSSDSGNNGGSSSSGGGTSGTGATDDNNHSTVFSLRFNEEAKGHKKIHIAENYIPEHDGIIGKYEANTPDGSKITYKILNMDGVPVANGYPLEIDEQGNLHLNHALDYEKEDEKKFEFKIQATSGSKSAILPVTLIVDDVYEGPTFVKTNYEATIAENEPSKTIITITATTPADGVDYKLLSKDGKELADDIPFAINSSGIITNKRSLDYETDPHNYEFIIQATANNITKDVNLTISITDIREEPTFEQAQYDFHINENQFVDTIIGNISVLNPENDQVTYQILGENGNPLNANVPFIITPDGIIKTTCSFNYETDINKYNLVVHANTTTKIDGKDVTKTLETKVSITINNVNEAAERFYAPQTYYGNSQARLDNIFITSTTPVNTRIGMVPLIDPEGQKLQYSIISGDDKHVFRISKNGDIFVVDKLEENNEYELLITAIDSDGNTNNVVVKITTKSPKDVLDNYLKLATDYGIYSTSFAENRNLNWSDGEEQEAWVIDEQGNINKEKVMYRTTTGQFYMEDPVGGERYLAFDPVSGALINNRFQHNTQHKINSLISGEAIHLTVKDEIGQFRNYNIISEITDGAKKKFYAEDGQERFEVTIIPTPYSYQIIPAKNRIADGIAKLETLQAGQSTKIATVTRNRINYNTIEAKEINGNLKLFMNGKEITYDPKHLTISFKETTRTRRAADDIDPANDVNMFYKFTGSNGVEYSARLYNLHIEGPEHAPQTLYNIDITYTINGQRVTRTFTNVVSINEADGVVIFASGARLQIGKTSGETGFNIELTRLKSDDLEPLIIQDIIEWNDNNFKFTNGNGDNGQVDMGELIEGQEGFTKWAADYYKKFMDNLYANFKMFLGSISKDSGIKVADITETPSMLMEHGISFIAANPFALLAARDEQNLAPTIPLVNDLNNIKVSEELQNFTIRTSTISVPENYEIEIDENKLSEPNNQGIMLYPDSKFSRVININGKHYAIHGDQYNWALYQPQRPHDTDYPINFVDGNWVHQPRLPGGANNRPDS